MPVQRFRRNGEEFDAVQFGNPFGNFAEIEAFVGGDSEWRGKLVVATPQGPLHAATNDWIVRNAGGEFFAAGPEDFRRDFEPVGEVIGRG